MVSIGKGFRGRCTACDYVSDLRNYTVTHIEGDSTIFSLCEDCARERGYENLVNKQPREYVSYLRYEGSREPYGVVVAIDAGHVGWSLCHPGDRFDKRLGKRIARSRAVQGGCVTDLYERWRCLCVLQDMHGLRIRTSRLAAMHSAASRVVRQIESAQEENE